MQIASKMLGRLAQEWGQEGDKARAGQFLARMDTRTLVAQVHRGENIG